MTLTKKFSLSICILLSLPLLGQERQHSPSRPVLNSHERPTVTERDGIYVTTFLGSELFVPTHKKVHKNVLTRPSSQITCKTDVMWYEITSSFSSVVIHTICCLFEYICLFIVQLALMQRIEFVIDYFRWKIWNCWDSRRVEVFGVTHKTTYLSINLFIHLWINEGTKESRIKCYEFQTNILIDTNGDVEAFSCERRNNSSVQECVLIERCRWKMTRKCSPQNLLRELRNAQKVSSAAR